ncbi:MAG: tyrosine-type recombinase/integrase [Steroidobacteraceae bacterium]
MIRLRVGRSVVHQEARTFALRTAALSWARHREVALEDPATLGREQQGAHTLAELIRWYIDAFETISQWQRSKQTHLEFLERHALGRTNALSLTAAMLIDHVRSRRAEGTGAATVANDLIWIGVVLRAARSVKELPIRPEVVQQARNACRELRLIGKARKRARRPTPDELARLREYFARRDERSTIRMLPVMEFAICSARREAEICRLEWRDNDAETRTGVVRDAKHPTDKDGNHRRFKYTPEAWAIVQAQPRTCDYIFPYDPKSVGTAFTRACHVLGIKDLRFHDLRHEATSRLFERGYQIHEVAQFTLHESWNQLKRYTNLRPENMRDIPPARVPSPAGDHGPAHTAVTPAFHAAGRSARRGRRHSPGRATSVRQA